MSTRIITDSVSDVPAEVAAQLGITIIPVNVIFGTESFRDGVDLTTEQFYEKLVQSKTMPTTAIPPMGVFVDTFDRIAADTDEILAITVSHRFSAFYDTTLHAAELMKQKCRVEVVDSGAGAMAEGLIVIAAAKAARAGGGLDDLVKLTRNNTRRAEIRMAFDTLEYLKRGGRIGAAQALMGSLLRVHPIAGIREGEGDTIGISRARQRDKAVNWLYDYARGFSGRIREMAVEHATTPDEAEAFVERLGTFFPKGRIYKSQVGCVVGAHIGPHVLSVTVMEETEIG